jgi:hypothetical protein
VVCKWTDSPTMDCPDVCLEALLLHEWELSSGTRWEGTQPLCQGTSCTCVRRVVISSGVRELVEYGRVLQSC